MAIPGAEASRQVYAKVAGLTFLIYMGAGATAVTLVDRATGAEGTAATLARVAAHASEVRLAILLELVECFSALVLGVALYQITRAEHGGIALLGLSCRVGEGVLGAIGIPKTMGLLWLATAGSAAGAPSAAAADSLGAYFLAPVPAALIGAPFFAVGSLAFAWLLLQGRMVPGPLAGLGVFASGLLVVGLPLQLAGFFRGSATGIQWMPMVVFQVLLGFWMLVKGVSTPVKPPRRGEDMG